MNTVLGFDFGVKRIGVAVGNTLIRQAQPLHVVHAANNNEKFMQIGELIQQWQPALCVVGLPRHPDGVEHEMSERCRRFANQLHGRFHVTVELVDERYSSAIISHQRGEVIDDRAAAVILQQYFDERS